jgi:hypothetical protein
VSVMKTPNLSLIHKIQKKKKNEIMNKSKDKDKIWCFHNTNFCYFMMMCHCINGGHKRLNLYQILMDFILF